MGCDHILIAALTHETNTFSPVPTPLGTFGPGPGPLHGDEAYERFRGTGTAIGGLIAAAENAGAAVSVPLVGRSPPSAPVDDAAYQVMTDALCSAVGNALQAGRCDALFLELHGAMVTRTLEDGEGHLLARLRRLAPSLPMALSLDFHANVTEAMVAAPTSITAYKTFPHLDMRECGEHTASITLGAMGGRHRPMTAWGNLPLLVHLQCMDTAQPPLSELMQMARDAEREPGVLAVSLLAGFPLADTREAGMSCIVVTDGDPALARSIRDRILAQGWRQREAFVMTPEPLEESVRRARSMAGKGRPVLLLDVADTCNSGGTLDSVEVLREILNQRLENVAAAPLCDPHAVAAMVKAGVGAQVELDLGAKVATPSIAARSSPLRLRGRVRAIHDEPITITGPVFTGTRLDPGTSVLFESGPLEIVITSRRLEPYDPGIFECLGVDVRSKHFLVLKSRMQCKPAFLPFSAGYVDCNGAGVTSSDFSQFRYRKLRRPIYPFDPDVTWFPGS